MEDKAAEPLWYATIWVTDHAIERARSRVDVPTLARWGHMDRDIRRGIISEVRDALINDYASPERPHWLTERETSEEGHVFYVRTNYDTRAWVVALEGKDIAVVTVLPRREPFDPNRLLPNIRHVG